MHIGEFGRDGLLPERQVFREVGIERLLRSLASEYLDERKLRDLEDLLQLEPWAKDSPVRLALL